MSQESQAKVWWYAKGGQKFGPFVAAELKKIANSGQLSATDLIWKEGLPKWLPASSVKGLVPAPASAVPPPLPPSDQHPVHIPQPTDADSTPTVDRQHAKPSSVVQTPPADSEPTEPDAIWNPGAAASWSLLFTPVFGTYIHMVNWRALKEHDRARKATMWFYIAIAVTIGSIVLSALLPNGRGAGSLVFWYLVIWYFAAGKAQVKYIKEKFGKAYPRRAWAKPLGIAGAGAVGYLLVAAFLFALGGNKPPEQAILGTWVSDVVPGLQVKFEPRKITNGPTVIKHTGYTVEKHKYKGQEVYAIYIVSDGVKVGAMYSYDDPDHIFFMDSTYSRLETN